MKKFIHIVACDQNNAIGKNNQLPWHIPEDLKRFKKLTKGCPVIMGRKTYESIGKALPDRTNIVVSRQDIRYDDAIVVRTIGKAALAALAYSEKDVYIIGGGQLYRDTLHVVKRIEMTRVNTIVEGADTFYPEIPLDQFKLIKTEHNHESNTDYLTYVKR